MRWIELDFEAWLGFQWAEIEQRAFQVEQIM